MPEPAEALSQPERERFRWFRPLLVFGLWVGLLLLLLVALPPAPRFRFRPARPCGSPILLPGSMTLMAFSAGGEDGPVWPVHFFNLVTGREIVVMHSQDRGPAQAWIQEEHKQWDNHSWVNQIVRVQLTPGESHVAVPHAPEEGQGDPTLCLINWRTGALVTERPFPTRSQWREAGGRFFVREFDPGQPRVAIWRSATREWETADWLTNVHSLSDVDFSPDGRIAVLRSEDYLRVWEVDTPRLLATIDGPPAAAVVREDNRQAVCVTRWKSPRPGLFRRTWTRLDLESQTALQEVVETREGLASDIRAPGNVRALAMAPDGRNVVLFEEPTPVPRFLLPTKRDPLRSASPPINDPAFDDWEAPHEDTAGIEFHEAARSPDGRWMVTSAVFSSSPFPAWLSSRVQPLWSFLDWVTGGGASDESQSRLALQGVADRRPIASLGHGSTRPDTLGFTDDSSMLVIQDKTGFCVWDVPPGRPWKNALLGSLAVPAAALLVDYCSRRRRVSRTRSS